ncbi:uncharacterized protein EAF02_003626 [Botrytis sinoallii]|uniref:uncharacterized protein n=1 Tax=Botrytis sinoallii TaxID=1463999 RepID=UPI00190156AB|nr:uncharacterized protein EAF02_003626 [Botrytis sinoallii]KAF7886979.1 hypothetical protein EAF02_003626 [Botrytis sinoallii]
MVISTSIAVGLASAVGQATSFTLFIYFSPPNLLHKYLSILLTDGELCWHQGHQFCAILSFFFTFIFSMSVIPCVLRIRGEKGDRSEHENALEAKTKDKTEEEPIMTKMESETNDIKEARSSKIQQSSEEVKETDKSSNYDELVEIRVELVNTKTALKKEQERVNRIEQVMESLQAQVDVLQARLTVKDAEAKNERKMVEAMEEDREGRADLLETGMMTLEAKIEEVLERLDENDKSHEAIGEWVEKFNSEGAKTKGELKRFDRVDKEINGVYRHLRKEVRKIQETAKGNLEELRADVQAVEKYWMEELQRIDDNRQSREWDLRGEIKTEIKNDLRREQEIKEIDEWWEKRWGPGGVTEEQLIAYHEAQDKKEAEVSNIASNVERSSHADAEAVETRVEQKMVENLDGDKKQEADPLVESETPIQEKKYPSHKAVEHAMQPSLDQERDAEMKDVDQGKDEVMEDITHELEDGAEVKEKGDNLDEEWTELRY